MRLRAFRGVGRRVDEIQVLVKFRLSAMWFRASC